MQEPRILVGHIEYLCRKWEIVISRKICSGIMYYLYINESSRGYYILSKKSLRV